MAIRRQPAPTGSRQRLRFRPGLPLLALVAPLLVAGAPAAASTPAAWEELRLRAVQTCTAELLSRNVNVLAVEPIDGSGAIWQPSDDGMRLRLKVQRPGQAAFSLLCSYRRPLLSPSLSPSP